jgi:N utilization substance protein B
MMIKTFKEVTEEHFAQVRLFSISRNWDDDRDFFIRLFDAALENEKEFDDIITIKSKKWAYERIADLDKIMLHLAIAEMIVFSSIPIKVTINEFVDISKEYSTPKSGQFINGMLDVIATDLEAQGRIRKSGRGLIDNKS